MMLRGVGLLILGFALGAQAESRPASPPRTALRVLARAEMRDAPEERLRQWFGSVRSRNEQLARNSALVVLRHAISPAQARRWLAEEAARDDDAGADARTRALEAAMRMHNGETDPSVHLRGRTTLAQLDEALVLGNDACKQDVIAFAAVLGRESPGTIAALVRCLASEHTALCWRAAFGLALAAGSPSTREALPSLLELLGRETDADTLAFAAIAATRIDAGAAVPHQAALELLAYHDERVRALALLSISRGMRSLDDTQRADVRRRIRARTESDPELLALLRAILTELGPATRPTR